jgi:hypothetical protein
MVVRKNVLEYIIALVVVKNKVRLKKCLKKFMINRVGKMCVAAMSLCLIVLIVTRKRGDGSYYFAL